MISMLLEKGLLPRDGASLKGKPRPHPEVLKVRIDRERSPIDAIPVDLRHGLFSIFLDHAQGAVRRNGGCGYRCRSSMTPASTAPTASRAPSPAAARPTEKYEATVG